MSDLIRPAINAGVKTGASGPKPSIIHVIWAGTAEINCVALHRVPAALVETTLGTMAVVRLYGHDLERDTWWDARLVESREWEDSDGFMIVDSAPDTAAAVDAFLATATRTHYDRGRQLANRVLRGTYEVAAGASS